MIKSFIDNPSECFAFDNYAAHQMPRAEVEAQQLAAINARFAALKDKILPLKILADQQNITSIDRLNDAAALFFPHTIYKSYPEQLLMTGRYDKMTDWLSRLTTVDMSPIAGVNYQTMDDWMDFMDEQTEMSILHSSGTTGRMSFFPRSKKEVQSLHPIAQMSLNDNLGVGDFRFGDRPNAFVWMAQAGGRTAYLRTLPVFVSIFAKSDENYYPLIPAMMSSDHHYYVMQCQNLLDQGIKEAPLPSDYVRMRVEEALQINTDMPILIERQLDVIAALKYKMHVSLFGSPLTVNRLVEAGLAKGMETMLMPGSVLGTGGGLKNNPEVVGMYDDFMRFTGQDVTQRDIYGMTELISSCLTCQHDHFHVPPWLMVNVLDIDTGEVLPREGIQKGRAAFFDFLMSTIWGGVVTGDMIEVNWGDCACGRKTPFILPTISRVEETGDPKYIGQASKKARDAVFESLSEGLVSGN